MRFFAVEGGEATLGVEPLRIVSEYVGDGNSADPIGLRQDPGDLTEQELLSLKGGREALDAWRAGDDSEHESAMRAFLDRSAFEDDLVAAGREARPDLLARLHDADSTEEIDEIMNEMRKAGAEALGST